MRLHGNLEVALWDAGRQVGIYGGILNAGDAGEKEDNDDRLGTVAVSYTYVKNQICNQLGEEYLEQSPLEQGADSLQFLESSTKNDICEIVVTYGDQSAHGGFGISKIPYGEPILWSFVERLCDSGD